MSYKHLSRNERGKIALMLRHKVSIREISRKLNRSASTISREVKRNMQNNQYKADKAHSSYVENRSKCHRKKLYENIQIVDYVSEKLMSTWSPEQIVGRIKLEGFLNPVSFTSIYRWLDEGLLPRAVQLKSHLRRFRKRKKNRKKIDSRADARSIKERAKNVLKRHRFGDWEVDTISFGYFPNQKYLLNINERKSKYCALVLLRNIKREELMRAFTMCFENSKLPLKTMTSDRGMEFNCHKQFEAAFKIPYYYTDKGKPWQKPTVENTNGLIRQFLPKGTKIEEIPSEQIQNIMFLLNNRPRKSLGFRTPAEVLHLA